MATTMHGTAGGMLCVLKPNDGFTAVGHIRQY
jgi:hypothetical protein